MCKVGPSLNGRKRIGIVSGSLLNISISLLKSPAVKFNDMMKSAVEAENALIFEDRRSDYSVVQNICSELARDLFPLFPVY